MTYDFSWAEVRTTPGGGIGGATIEAPSPNTVGQLGRRVVGVLDSDGGLTGHGIIRGGALTIIVLCLLLLLMLVMLMSHGSSVFRGGKVLNGVRYRHTSRRRVWTVAGGVVVMLGLLLVMMWVVVVPA